MVNISTEKIANLVEMTETSEELKEEIKKFASFSNSFAQFEQTHFKIKS